MKRFVTLLLFAIAATAARVAVVWFTEPSPSEAYYFLCSQNPAAAYFDGPGGTAAVTGLASLEANSDIMWRVAALRDVRLFWIGAFAVRDRSGCVCRAAVERVAGVQYCGASCGA